MEDHASSRSSTQLQEEKDEMTDENQFINIKKGIIGMAGNVGISVFDLMPADATLLRQQTLQLNRMILRQQSYSLFLLVKHWCLKYIDQRKHTSQFLINDEMYQIFFHDLMMSWNDCTKNDYQHKIHKQKLESVTFDQVLESGMKTYLSILYYYT